VKRWIVAVAVAWGLVVAGLAYYSVRHGKPTVRDQTTIAQALPTVDAALADLSAALDPAASVPVLGGYSEIGKSCSLTAVRDGARYERMLVVYVAPGTEPAALQRVARGLPARYGAALSHNILQADAGNYVAIHGGVDNPGEVRFTADTGCRPIHGTVHETEPSSVAASRAPVQAVLDTLHLSAARWHTHRVDCPTGGSLWTVEAASAAATAPASLAAALNVGSAALIDTPNLVAFRTGPAGVAARASNGTVTVTSTTSCGQ
jgi:hypothetical protein